MGYLGDRLFTLYHSLSPSTLVSSNTGGFLALNITENWMTELIQIDTFSRLVAEKDGEIVYLKYITLFHLLRKTPKSLYCSFYSVRNTLIYNFVRAVSSKMSSYPLQIHKLEEVNGFYSSAVSPCFNFSSLFNSQLSTSFTCDVWDSKSQNLCS